MGLTFGGVFVAGPIGIAAAIYLLAMLSKAKSARARDLAAAIFLFAVIAGGFLGMTVDHFIDCASSSPRTDVR